MKSGIVPSLKVPAFVALTTPVAARPETGQRNNPLAPRHLQGGLAALVRSMEYPRLFPAFHMFAAESRFCNWEGILRVKGTKPVQ